ncbi:hypothetical protein ABPG74_005883 [Tetrahymena malaccensis]
MLWDVLIQTLFPNRVTYSMEQQEIARVVYRLQQQITHLREENTQIDLNKCTDSGTDNPQNIITLDDIQNQPTQMEEKAKTTSIPRLSSESELFMSSRSTSCCGLTPSFVGRCSAIDFITSPDRSTHSIHPNSSHFSQFNTTNMVSYAQNDEAIKEDLEFSRIITEEDLATQERSDKSNSFVQAEGEQIYKTTPVRKEIEIILMEYLFEYAQEKVESKDSLNSIDLASFYMNSRQNLMHKEEIIKLLIKDHANQKKQNEFVKKQFEICSSVLEIIPQSDTIKILLFQLRLVQAIILIYGHSLDQDLIKLVSLFCIIDDKSIKKILEPFGINGYSSCKKSLHYKHLSQIIEKSAVKSVLFATASHLIDSLNNQTRKSVQLFSSFMSNGKFNDPKISCQRAEIGFDNLSVDLDSSGGI